MLQEGKDLQQLVMQFGCENLIEQQDHLLSRPARP
jgi:hypothetical protein